MVEIRAAEPRFTSDEAGAYLNEVAGLGLVADDVSALDERTEGWIAAPQLAALSIQGRRDAREFIARFAGNDRYIVDYLVEEVLQHQPDEVLSFLLQSAVLDRLTGSLCDALTGRDDGSDMLMAAERANHGLAESAAGRAARSARRPPVLDVRYLFTTTMKVRTPPSG